MKENWVVTLVFPRQPIVTLDRWAQALLAARPSSTSTAETSTLTMHVRGGPAADALERAHACTLGLIDDEPQALHVTSRSEHLRRQLDAELLQKATLQRRRRALSSARAGDLLGADGHQV